MLTSVPSRIVLVGGGYVGVCAARRLERLLAPGEAELTLVTPENFMLYQPLLPEVASSTLEPRHVVVPLRQALRRTRLVTGRLRALDAEGRRATVQPYEGEPYDLPFDHVVIGLGSMTRVLPVPGLAEQALGFSSLTEAAALRDQVLERLEAAAATADPAARRRALTFVFVGAGYAGVEAIGELEALARSACRWFPTIHHRDLRWVLVEAADRMLPFLTPGLSDLALRTLRRRGIEVLLETTLTAAEGGRVRLSDGSELATDTLVWCAGVQPNRLVGELGLPTDERGHLVVDRSLRVEGSAHVWAAGDCAAVPDPHSETGFSPATAQHAQRQGQQVAANIAAVLRGHEPAPFDYRSRGELVTLGRLQGVGTVLGVPVTGPAAWLVRRLYYAARIPTVQRKARILVEWLVGALFPHDISQLGSIRAPRAPFEEAADTGSADTGGA